MKRFFAALVCFAFAHLAHGQEFLGPQALEVRVDALAAVVRRPVEQKPIKNIEDYGAIPVTEDDDFDNAPAIQSAIDAIGRDQFGAVVVPGKAYVIKQTIKIPSRFGMRFQGAGGFTKYETIAQHKKNHKRRGGTSILIWKGPPDRPMVTYAGYGLVWDSVNLFGRPAPTQGQPDKWQGKEAWCGLLFLPNRDAIGTGKAHIPTISIYGCQNGIAFGDPTNVKATHADNVAIGYYNATGCGVAYRVFSEQSVSHCLYGLFRPYFTDVGFQFDAGGKFNCSGVIDWVSPGTLLKIDHAGSNTGTYKLSQVTIDNRVVRDEKRDANGVRIPITTSRLVTTSRGVPSIVIESANFPAQPVGVLFDLRGATRLTLRDGFGVRKGMVHGESRRVKWGDGTRKTHAPYVSLESCRMNRDWESPDEIYSGTSTGTRRAAWSHCTNWHLEPLGGISAE